ncbi:triple QxxK/R motif-containing protein-like isoform X2 [Ruditapes philippinarum]|nr:triple QxxK/R motif-containing protein-like [Ruditapes philippinarum]XP_060608149.1 triple QxxK/R motif-containing protein-like isoform X2 [Ruditapes philippinarum]
MGKKDASGIHGTQVDQYRKQIGKQDYKKAKKSLKASKAAHDLKKSSTPVKDTILIVLTGLCAVVALYLTLYWYLNNKEPIFDDV